MVSNSIWIKKHNPNIKLLCIFRYQSGYAQGMIYALGYNNQHGEDVGVFLKKYKYLWFYDAA